MKELKHLPEAELKIMEIVWSLKPPVTAMEVEKNAGMKWKTTSVLTFLSRLCEKGFLTREKDGRQNLYTPVVAKADYLQNEGKSFVKRMYGGSVKNLVASLSDAGALSDDDITELRAFLDSQG